MVNFSLEGKVALVTGASYGIGLQLQQVLHRLVQNCIQRHQAGTGRQRSCSI